MALYSRSEHADTKLISSNVLDGDYPSFVIRHKNPGMALPDALAIHDVFHMDLLELIKESAIQGEKEYELVLREVDKDIDGMGYRGCRGQQGRGRDFPVQS